MDGESYKIFGFIVECLGSNFLFAASILYIDRLHSYLKNFGVLMFSVYLIITFVFALGIGNYGTVLRHQIITNWIIILFGTPFIMWFLMSFFEKITAYEKN